MRRQRYYANATWKDVLKGKPVTKDDRQKTKRKPTTLRCRDCGRMQTMKSLPVRPRCEVCGGIPDPVEP